MKTMLISIFIILLTVSVYAIEKSKTITISKDIQLIEIKKDFYVHKSYTNSSQYGRFSSNGMLVIKNGKALMIDTPFTNEETEIIYKYLQDSMQTTITIFIGGHFHEDCIGGMEYLKNKGVKTILNSLTKSFCIQLNLPLPDTTFTSNYQFKFEGVELECRFLGGGHSADNIVVHFPEEEILFGGCLIKSAESRSIGNTADAVLDEWMSTVEKVSKQYPTIEFVVPGHGNYGNATLLSHTIEIVTTYLQNNIKE